MGDGVKRRESYLSFEFSWREGGVLGFYLLFLLVVAQASLRAKDFQQYPIVIQGTLSWV